MSLTAFNRRRRQKKLKNQEKKEATKKIVEEKKETIDEKKVVVNLEKESAKPLEQEVIIEPKPKRRGRPPKSETE